MNDLIQITSIFLVSILLSGCLELNAEWENEEILFINSENKEEVVISQSLDYGATDSNPSTRFMIFNIKSKDMKVVQLENLDTAWVKLPNKIAVSPFRGYMFYEGELKNIEKFGCNNFPHHNLIKFTDVLLSDDQYQNIYPSGAGSKYYYSCQYSNNTYNSFVFRSGGGLILQTTNSNFKPISHLELMRKNSSNEFVYNKYSEIISNSSIDLTDSISIDLSKQNGFNIDDCIVLTYKNNFTISNNGEIQNKTTNGIGKIEIKTVASKTYKQCGLTGEAELSVLLFHQSPAFQSRTAHR